jgi:ABC-type glycerol-3-phosphate transport system substrate-binding protein
MLNVQQIYYRRDILEKAGISTEQPKTWAELLDRAKEIKAKTGAYGLLFPAGVTWGGGSFTEGFRLLIVGTSTPQIANADGTLNLTGQGIKDAFGISARRGLVVDSTQWQAAFRRVALAWRLTVSCSTNPLFGGSGRTRPTPESQITCAMCPARSA